MNAKDIGTMALIAGVGAAATVADLNRHVDGSGKSAADTKHHRKQRNQKKRIAKASRKRNRR